MPQSLIFEFLKILGGVSTALLGLGFLTKILVSHLLQKEVEKYKHELETSRDLRLNEIQNDFKRRITHLDSQLLTLQHQRSHRFTKLHDERFAIVQTLYSKFLKYIYAPEISAKSGESKTYNIDRGEQEVKYEMERVEVFFSADFVRGWLNSVTILAESFRSYRQALEYPLQNGQPDLPRIDSAWKLYEEQRLGFKRQCVEEMRAILGVERMPTHRFQVSAKHVDGSTEEILPTDIIVSNPQDPSAPSAHIHFSAFNEQIEAK